MKIDIMATDQDNAIRFETVPKGSLVEISIFENVPVQPDTTEVRKIANFTVLLTELIASLQTLARMK